MQRAISTSPAAGKPGGPRARWSAHSPPTSARACPRSAPCLGARRGWPFGAPDQESVISARQYKKIMDTIEYDHRVTKTARTHAQTHSTTNKTHTHTHTHTHKLTLSHTHTHLSVHSLDVLCHYEFVQADLFPFGNATRPRHHLSAHLKSKHIDTSHARVAVRVTCMPIFCLHVMRSVGM